MIRARAEFEKVCLEFRMARFAMVSKSMKELDAAIEGNDIEKFFNGLSVVMSFYGESVAYTDFDGFDRDMLDEAVVIKI